MNKDNNGFTLVELIVVIEPVKQIDIIIEKNTTINMQILLLTFAFLSTIPPKLKV